MYAREVKAFIDRTRVADVVNNFNGVANRISLDVR